MKNISLLLLIFMVSTAAVFAQEGEYGKGSTKILIAFEPTRFKKALVEDMVALLDDGSRSILVVNHQKKGLEGLRSEDFDVVFISNSGAMAKVRPDVTSWLEANGTDPSNVIVHTTQRTVWTPQIEVDSITSASMKKKDEIGSMAKDLVQRIIDRQP